MNTPLVSVAMLTYNHAPFIAKAIESVLMQDVNFAYELVIADDASTDGTSDIVKYYAEKYPEKIVAVVHEKNLGMAANSIFLRNLCCGKYTANLEGDDYWTDANKLQIQVDFLRNNPEFTAVFTDYIDVDENGNPIKNAKTKKSMIAGEEFTICDFENYLMAGHINTKVGLPLSSMLLPEQLKIYDESSAIGDTKFNLAAVMCGRVKKIPIVTSAYRQHSGQWTKSVNYNMNADMYRNMLELEKLAQNLFGKKLCYRKVKMRCWYGIFISWLKHPSKETFGNMRKVFNNENNKLGKLVFLFTHTISFPFRKLYAKIIGHSPRLQH